MRIPSHLFICALYAALALAACKPPKLPARAPKAQAVVPEVQITSHERGDWVLGSGGAITLAGRVSHARPERMPKQVEVFLNGRSAGTAPVGAGRGWQLPMQLERGPNAVLVIAKDASGAAGDSSLSIAWAPLGAHRPVDLSPSAFDAPTVMRLERALGALGQAAPNQFVGQNAGPLGRGPAPASTLGGAAAAGGISYVLEDVEDLTYKASASVKPLSSQEAEITAALEDLTATGWLALSGAGSPGGREPYVVRMDRFELKLKVTVVAVGADRLLLQVLGSRSAGFKFGIEGWSAAEVDVLAQAGVADAVRRDLERAFQFRMLQHVSEVMRRSVHERALLEDAVVVRMDSAIFPNAETVLARLLPRVLASRFPRNYDCVLAEKSLAGLRLFRFTLLSLDSIQHGPLSVTLKPGPLGMDVALVMPQARLTGKYKHDGSILPDFTDAIELTVDRAVATVRISVAARADGSVGIDARTTGLRLDGFKFDLHGIPRFVEKAKKAAAETRVRERVTALVERSLPVKLERILRSAVYLDVREMFAPRFRMLASGMEATGFNASVFPGAIRSSAAGVEISLNSRFQLPGGTGAPWSPGIAVTPSSPPAHPAGRHLSIAISDEMFNQVLYGLWASGMLESRIDQAWLDANGIDLGPGVRLDGRFLLRYLPELKGPAFAGLFAPDRPISLRARTTLPPHLAFASDPSSGEPTIQLNVGDLVLEAWLEGEAAPLVSLAAQFKAELALGVEQVYDPRTGIATQAVVVRDVRTDPAQVLVDAFKLDPRLAGLDPWKLEAPFGAMLNARNLLGDAVFQHLVQGLRVQLPAGPDFRVSRLSFERAGAKGDWLMIAGDLEVK